MNKKTTSGPVPDKLKLQLYVAGMAMRSMQAIERVTKFCDTHWKDNYELEIIDLYKNPELAAARQIVFSPSLIKQRPLPRKMMIGDFSNADRLLSSLGLPYKED